MRSASWHPINEKALEKSDVKDEAAHGIGQPFIVYPVILIVGSVIIYLLVMVLPVLVSELGKNL
jgi:hypothetical protein